MRGLELTGARPGELAAFPSAHHMSHTLREYKQDLGRIAEQLVDPDIDLAGNVFVFDTLKKITSVISKVSASSVYKLLRSLTGRGATVICLGHCNKYPDADGWPIYEGTSDLSAR